MSFADEAQEAGQLGGSDGSGATEEGDAAAIDAENRHLLAAMSPQQVGWHPGQQLGFGWHSLGFAWRVQSRARLIVSVWKQSAHIKQDPCCRA